MSVRPASLHSHDSAFCCAQGMCERPRKDYPLGASLGADEQEPAGCCSGRRVSGCCWGFHATRAWESQQVTAGAPGPGVQGTPCVTCGPSWHPSPCCQVPAQDSWALQSSELVQHLFQSCLLGGCEAGSASTSCALPAWACSCSPGLWRGRPLTRRAWWWPWRRQDDPWAHPAATVLASAHPSRAPPAAQQARCTRSWSRCTLAGASCGRGRHVERVDACVTNILYLFPVLCTTF